MTNLIHADAELHQQLLPLTFARPVADLRCGILTLAEKWSYWLPQVQNSFLPQLYLRDQFPAHYSDDNYYLAGGLCPDEQLAAAILELPPETALEFQDRLLVVRTAAQLSELRDWNGPRRALQQAPVLLEHPWDIFAQNGAQLELDFQKITAGRQSARLSSTNQLLGDRIFAEEGARAEAAILNSLSGPIYLGAKAEVMEGSVVRGPLAMAPHSVLKLASKVYGPTTLGPYCKVGGEVNNSVFQAFSNKGHDGFLGNAVIGAWCNIGADTNNSNLKNNYDEIKLWSYAQQRFIRTGRQFCGLIMGDHSKCGINTMFNTGTVVGFSANIFGAGFPRNFIPSFSWGGAAGLTQYQLPKALDTARRMMSRRQIELSAADEALFRHILEHTPEWS